jgi:hypothetical protein
VFDSVPFLIAEALSQIVSQVVADTASKGDEVPGEQERYDTKRRDDDGKAIHILAHTNK